MNRKILFVILIIAILSGCRYNNEEELYNCNIDPANTKYSTTITSIINSYGCLSCHSAGVISGGVNLKNYAGVKTVASDGKLFGAINHSTGFIPMPLGGGKMNRCDIKKVKAWIDAGAPNN